MPVVNGLLSTPQSNVFSSSTSVRGSAWHLIVPFLASFRRLISESRVFLKLEKASSLKKSTAGLLFLTSQRMSHTK